MRRKGASARRASTFETEEPAVYLRAAGVRAIAAAVPGGFAVHCHWICHAAEAAKKVFYRHVAF